MTNRYNSDGDDTAKLVLTGSHMPTVVYNLFFLCVLCERYILVHVLNHKNQLRSNLFFLLSVTRYCGVGQQ